MSGVVFLSASVPDPKLDSTFAATADPVAITAAVTALIYVTLGRRRLVWGGHPAITPMVLVVAESLNVDYEKWITLYQSKLFEPDFPDETKRFQNVRVVDSVDGDQKKSLRLMRETMFRENAFESAVFIGGMSGILDEYGLLKLLQPKAIALPVFSTGGAVLEMQSLVMNAPKDLHTKLDYISLFHDHLKIDKRELRFATPDVQPRLQSERLWAFQHPK